MKSKIKIFFIIPKLISGGAERTFVNILNSINKRNYICTLVVYNKSGSLFQELDENIHVISLNINKSILSVHKLAIELRKHKPDIVFSTLRYINFLTIISCYLSLIKTKIIIRETNHHTEAGVNNSFKESIINYSYKFVDHIVALSNGVKIDIIERCNIKGNKIEVIYNPINIKQIKQKKEEKIIGDYLNEFNDKNNFKIINIGHLEHQKGQDLLIEAVSLLDHRNFKLFIVGEGSKRKDLENLINKKKLSKQIILMGYQSNPYNLLMNSDIFILSSRWEGFGHVIVESMVCNTPVISTNCRSGPSEIILDGYDGLLCKTNSPKDMKDKLEYLISNSKKRKQIVINAENKAKLFEDNIIVKKYEDLFYKVQLK